VHKLRELLGEGKRTRLATESELALRYAMLELRAVPPVGGTAGGRVIFDRGLANSSRLCSRRARTATSWEPVRVPFSRRQGGARGRNGHAFAARSPLRPCSQRPAGA